MRNQVRAQGIARIAQVTSRALLHGREGSGSINHRVGELFSALEPPLLTVVVSAPGREGYVPYVAGFPGQRALTPGAGAGLRYRLR